MEPRRRERPAFRRRGFFGKQVTAAPLCSAYAFVFTYVMLWLINLITPVKVPPEGEEQGLDIALHGERPYPLGL